MKVRSHWHAAWYGCQCEFKLWTWKINSPYCSSSLKIEDEQYITRR